MNVMRNMFAGNLAVTTFLLALISSVQALEPGDIVFLNWQVDFPNIFQFAPLVNIPLGTVVYFTDNGVLEGGIELRSGEGILQWTANEVVKAGTLVTYIENESNEDFELVEGTFVLSPAGDQLFAYQLEENDTNPSFIAAIQGNGSQGQFDRNATGVNTSAKPATLTIGITAVGVGGALDNHRYDGTVTSATRSELLAAINDYSNWESSNTPIGQFSSSLTVTDLVSPMPSLAPSPAPSFAGPCPEVAPCSTGLGDRKSGFPLFKDGVRRCREMCVRRNIVARFRFVLGWECGFCPSEQN